jgi:hypothetical protein
MIETVPNLAVRSNDITRGISALHDALERAARTASLPSESDLLLLSAVVGAALSIALLPVAVPAAAGGSLIAGVVLIGDALSLSSSLAATGYLGAMKAIELTGLAHVTEGDYATMATAKSFTGGLFSLTGGVIGAAWNGYHGFEVGTTAGEFMDVFGSINHGIGDILEHADSYHRFLYAESMLQGLIELPYERDPDSARAGHEMWSADFDHDSVADDLVFNLPGIAERPPPLPDVTRIRANRALDEHVFAHIGPGPKALVVHGPQQQQQQSNQPATPPQPDQSDQSDQSHGPLWHISHTGPPSPLPNHLQPPPAPFWPSPPQGPYFAPPLSTGPSGSGVEDSQLGTPTEQSTSGGDSSVDVPSL